MNVRYMVLSSVAMKSTTFWDVTPCSQVEDLEIHTDFNTLACCFVGVPFDPDEDSMCLRNFSNSVSVYTASCPRRQDSSQARFGLSWKVPTRGRYVL
jgi:hypothetical protein